MDVLQSFGFDIRLLVASTINFVILLIILNKILYRPLLAVLDERRKKIAESLDNAQLIEKKLQETEEKQRDIVHQARESAQAMLDAAQTHAKVREEELIKQAELRSQEIMQKAHQSATEMVTKMEHEFKQTMAVMIMEATKSILEKHTPKELTEEYVKTTLKTMSKS